MESKIFSETTYILTLNEKEAQWLRGIIQNPLNGKTPEEEFEYDSNMRKLFWDSLTKQKEYPFIDNIS